MEPTDFNALAFDQNSTRDPLQKHFIPREGSRKRGLEIEFDPTRHRLIFWDMLLQTAANIIRT